MKIKIGNKTFEVSKEELDGNPEELTLEFQGTLRTTEEETTFTENLKKEAHTAGAEKALRTKADELGLEIDGSKRNIDDVFNAYAKKVLEDAKIEPAEQLKKIKTTLEEKETALTNALSKVTEKENEFKSYKNQSILDKKLDSFIPDNTILPKEDIKTILKTKLKFDVDDNGNVLALDNQGNIIKDPTTANPKEANDVVSNFFKDNQSYLKPIEGGAGGSDSGSKGNKKSLDKFIEEQQAKDIKINSPEFNEAYAKAVEAGLVEVE
jgi:hypothetical protein